MKVWYARVSSYGQNFNTQVEKLKTVGCEKIFTEKMSWASTKERRELENALSFCRDGDVLVVTKLDRLARSMFDLQNILKRLQNTKVDFVVLDQQIDTTTPAWKLTFNLLGSVAEFERELINERIREWVERARANGVKFWAKLKLTPEKVDDMMNDLRQWISREKVCEKYWISSTTCYRLCPAGDVFDAEKVSC